MNYRLLSLCFVLQSFIGNVSLMEAHISVVQTPFATGYTPNSILANPPPEEKRYAGKKVRYSTCTGTAWLLGDKFLAAINLVTSSIQVYQFDEENRTLLPLKVFDNSDGLTMNRPENLSFSNDHKLLAIPNMKSGDINIYNISQNTFVEKSPGAPFFMIHDRMAHGATFSPFGNYLAYVSTDDVGGIYIYKISKDNGAVPVVTFLQKMTNAFYPLQPKSIDFSHDGRFAVIGYSVKISNKKGRAKAALASYAVDNVTGKINEKPLSVVKKLSSIETVQFYIDSSCVFSVDQVKDRVMGHKFDLKTGKLGSSWEALKNPKAELNFPHGMNFSSDGRFLSISNYGEDKVTVYQIERNNEVSEF